MENVAIPSENACTPSENANEPLCEIMTPPAENDLRKKLTFDESFQLTDKSSSQNSSVYKEILSQPASSLSHRQKLLWLQKRRSSGLWVQCDKCDRWRFMPDVLDNHQLPNKWFCELNPDPNAASCNAPEVPIRLRDEEDLIHSVYSAGSVVWARMGGWPWWPAMVDDCPDTEQYYWLDGFSDIPTHYNVTFFDSGEVTRAWISPENLKPFETNRKSANLRPKDKKYKKRIDAAVTQANHAILLPVPERLAKYSFVEKYKGSINSPKKVSKETLLKFQKKLKRKYNVEFPIEISSASEDECEVTRPLKRQNVILVGTPKRDKAEKAKSRTATEINVTDTPITVDNDGHDEENAVQNDSLLHIPQDVPISEKQDCNGLKPVFKHPNNSMAVQIGSSADSKVNTEAVDNDSSKTYVPDSQLTNSVTTNLMDSQNIEIRIASPSSDDFDF